MKTNTTNIETIEQVGRDILGVQVRDLTREDAIAYVLDRIDAKIHSPIAFLNAHNANVAVDDGAFRTALRQFHVLSDGIGVDLAGRVLHHRPFRANLNGTDFVPALFVAADRPLKVGLFGGRPGVAEAAANAFSAREPRHAYTALAHGFIDDTQTAAMLDTLKTWRPDILLVALGVPLQEKWIAANITPAHCTVPIGVGALFDFSSGTVPRAPGWVRAARGEWAYRLVQEPGRLWRRYLIGNPLFLMRVLRQRLSGRPPSRSTG